MPPLELLLTLDGDGRLDRRTDPVARLPETKPTEGPTEPMREVLVESLRKTVVSLFGRLSLPGRPVGAGQVRLRVSAIVTDVAPTKLTIDGRAEVDPSFTLESGRRVTFRLEVLEVVPAERDATIAPSP